MSRSADRGEIMDGEVETYREIHRFRMLNYNEMKRFLFEAGFCEVKCFGSYLDRDAAESQARRLIFAAVK